MMEFNIYFWIKTGGFDSPVPLSGGGPYPTSKSSPGLF